MLMAKGNAHINTLPKIKSEPFSKPQEQSFSNLKKKTEKKQRQSTKKFFRLLPTSMQGILLVHRS